MNDNDYSHTSHNIIRAKKFKNTKN